MAEPRAGGEALSIRTASLLGRGRRTGADRGPDWNEYCSRWCSLHGGFDPRQAPVLVRGWQRFAFAVSRGLVRLRAGPSLITSLGVGCSVAVPLVVLPGGSWVFLAAGLVVLAALADSADSGVAVLTGATTGFGSFYDSVADRCSEIAWLVALWLLGAPGFLVAACGAQALLHEYARSRAALAGMPGVGALTVAERPTRVLVAVGGLLAGGVGGLVGARLAAGAVTVALAVWLVLGILGAAKLLSAIRAALHPDDR